MAGEGGGSKMVKIFLHPDRFTCVRKTLPHHLQAEVISEQEISNPFHLRCLMEIAIWHA